MHKLFLKPLLRTPKYLWFSLPFEQQHKCGLWRRTL